MTEVNLIFLVYILSFVGAVVMLFLSVVLMLPASVLTPRADLNIFFIVSNYFVLEDLGRFLVYNVFIITAVNLVVVTCIKVFGVINKPTVVEKLLAIYRFFRFDERLKFNYNKLLDKVVYRSPYKIGSDAHFLVSKMGFVVQFSNIYRKHVWSVIKEVFKLNIPIKYLRILSYGPHQPTRVRVLMV